MPRAAVLGHPIAHSLSPALHRAAYAALGLANWRYDAIDCDTPELAGLLATHRPPEWGGFSATMPLKRPLLDLADDVEPLARRIGSANTLLPRDGGWYATTTDVAGIGAALAEHAIEPRSVTVLGAGGTAQAVLGALYGRGTTRCEVLVRDVNRAAELRATAERLELTVTLGILAADAPALGADLVVSTLPAYAADPLAAYAWTPGQAVFDAVYNPWPSALAEAAERAGATVVSGALLLLHQAAFQVGLMTGRDAPVPAMRAALAAALPHAGV